ncbi:potassium channel family protein [Candidatus Halobeggiatoa sp. HSG11]|nr:potassium channel family protein [Candidatus Halobeggiatoa sp. HSG11]
MFSWLKKFKNNSLETDDLQKKFIYSLLYLLIIFTLHITAMVSWEELRIDDAIWLTFTTITTVGYGDIQISSLPGRLATIILLYLGGIFVLAKTAGDYFDYRSIRNSKQIKGKWRWNMNNHIVLISNNDDNIPILYYERLITEFQHTEEYKNLGIQILTQDFHDGLPESLQKLNITHYYGKGNKTEDLKAVNANAATIIMIMACKHHDQLSDGNTFDVLHRIRDLNKDATIIVECVDDVNRERLKQAGANITLRPVRAYPEMMVSVLRAPGSEEIIEQMFNNQDNKYQRVNVVIKDQEWSEIVYRLVKSNIGIAVAYISPNDKIYCNPNGEDKVIAKGLIIMTINLPDNKTVETVLNSKTA